MRYISGAIYAGSPPASPNFVIKLECRMEYDVCTPLANLERKYSFRRVLWCPRLIYSAIFGAPVLPVRAMCLKYTILSAPLHPHFGSFLLGWVTHTHYWHEYMCHSFFGPCACASSTAAPMPHQHVKARGSTTGACMCPLVQACQCSLCIVFAIVYW